MLQAYAGARMAESVLLGLNGEEGIIECTYVESSIIPGLTYFSSKVGFMALHMHLRAHAHHTMSYCCGVWV